MRLPLLLAVSICSMPLAELAAAYTSYSPDPLLSPIVVSEDGVTVTQTQRNGLGSTRSIDAVGGGKHYWEVMATCGPDTYGFTVGVATINTRNSNNSQKDLMFITNLLS